MSKVYLALYKGNGGSIYDRMTDWIIRLYTGSLYSHCEIVIENTKKELVKPPFSRAYHQEITGFDLYSSSPRDKGVRTKRVYYLSSDKWELIPLPKEITENQIKTYFAQTQGAKYDIFGALGIVLGIKHSRSKFFCSEWCYNAIFKSNNGWQYSPKDLAEKVRSFC